MYFKFKQSTLLAVLSILVHTCAISLESAKEQSCLPINKTAQMDFEWMMSVKEWYYPLMSRLDLYLTSLELYGSIDNPSQLRESQIYYESCIKAEFVGSSAIGTGFNGKFTAFSVELPTVAEDGVISQRFISESGLGMTIYITLTDNVSYVFMVGCWDDNQASWGVISTVAKLPKKTVQNIYEHAESLGFKKEYFEELRYDSCNKEQSNTISIQGDESCAK